MNGWKTSLFDRFFRCEAPPNQRYFGCVQCDVCGLLIFVPFHFPSKKITIQDFSFYNFQAFQRQIKSIQKIFSKPMTILHKNACCFSWWASGPNWWFFSNVMRPRTWIHTHCCRKKSCTSWDVSNPVNDGIKLPTSTGASISSINSIDTNFTVVKPNKFNSLPSLKLPANPLEWNLVPLIGGICDI